MLGRHTNIQPPLSISYEYCLATDAFDVEGLSLGVGAAIGTASMKYFTSQLEYSGSDFVQTASNKTCRYLLMTPKGYLHYDVLGCVFDSPNVQLDTYLVFSLGARACRCTVETMVDGVLGTSETTHPNRLALGLQLGARYWIYPNFGLTVEAGYDGISIANIGINACF